jgi:exodeoxyribonuclease V gamma subunit
MREMEILQDRLLHHFERDPSLKPSDILVMTPDIDRYAPFVSAGFNLPREDGRWMPFSIADRGLRPENPIADGLFRLLDLTTGRFEASQVFDFLQCPALDRALAFSDDELSLVQDLIESGGIRWGIDGAARAALGLPADGANTWREGLERLLLGYALPEGSDGQLFMGRLPCDTVAEADEATLERFFLIMDRLFSVAADLAGPRSPARWSETLGEVLSLFFAVQDEAFFVHAQSVREGLAALADTARTGQFHEKVGLAAIRIRLEESIQTSPWGYGFLTGGVTFCAMLPMRSIPFRMVCMVGMDDDAYPRRPPRLGFDLMTHSPRPGDPDRRGDDRYLFLEALLSARQTPTSASSAIR